MASRHQEERVRERAYHLWRESGGEHGRAMDHWLQAERDVGTGPDESTPKRASRAAKAKASPPAAKPAASRAGAPAKPRAKRSAAKA